MMHVPRIFRVAPAADLAAAAAVLADDLSFPATSNSGHTLSLPITETTAPQEAASTSTAQPKSKLG